MFTFTLSAIYIYPVKSLTGIAVKEWKVNPKGLVFDRHWMIIDRDNRFLSQRQIPRMCLIQTSLDNDRLTLTTPDKNSIAIPLNSDAEPPVGTSLWQDHCQAYPVAKEVDLWLSDFLHHDCRLVCQTEQPRRVDPKYAAADDQTAFTDGFPFLIVSENALSDLNRRLQYKMPMNRFRPNLVITGCGAYAEDTWRQITIGEITFRLPKPCSRCVITTIDTQTAKINKEPLKALNKYRNWRGKVYFGQNALHDNSGILRVGDAVKILQYGPSQPPLKKAFAK